MIKFRILGLVVFFLTVAFLGVVAVRTANIPAPWVEAISARSLADAGNIKTDLTFIVRGSTLEISVPNCAVDLYPERFLLHVYPENGSAMVSEKFINLDFFLAKESAKRVSKSGDTVCRYKKTFRVQARKVEFGQYDLPNGRCCRILWSRTFYPTSKQVN